MTDVDVTIGGERFAGWTRAAVRRSLEQVSGTFRAGLADPGIASLRALWAGAPCQVSLDGETVIDGHVDRVRNAYDESSHELEIAGRDRTGDLVDCSAPSRPGEWHGVPLDAIATAIASPFGISVSAPDGVGAPIRRHRIEEGETCFEAIDRACRLRALLAMSDARGGLVLGRPERGEAAVRLVRGENILRAAAEVSLVERYSTYRVLGQQAGGDFIRPEAAAHVRATASDPGVGRDRPLTIIAEQALDDVEAAERAMWEADVRRARSERVTVMVQGWRERGGSGALWAPGTLVHVVDDWLGIDRSLLVAAVEQALDEEGTRTTLTLLPARAFAAEPIRPSPSEPHDWRAPEVPWT